MPVSTMWALRNFDASTADPASLRAAIRIPESLEPRPGGVTLEVGWWRDGDEAKHDAKFVLQESTAETGSLAGERKPGTRIYAYRVNPADFAAIRAMQAEVLTEKKKAGAATHGVFGIGADACREADLASGPLYITTFLKTGESDWLPDAAEGRRSTHAHPEGYERRRAFAALREIHQQSRIRAVKPMSAPIAKTRRPFALNGHRRDGGTPIVATARRPRASNFATTARGALPGASPGIDAGRRARRTEIRVARRVYRE
ncbi:hypothetical protein [Methylocella sp.]|uniref:hypothetical protein n=1 Tax=Methylocella sp. TaxID=1978226 RepID=UPI003C25A73F